jgi:hypothetical protein
MPGNAGIKEKKRWVRGEMGRGRRATGRFFGSIEEVEHLGRNGSCIAINIGKEAAEKTHAMIILLSNKPLFFLHTPS